MAKAAVRKDLVVQPTTIPASGIKAGRSREEALALRSQFGDTSKVSYADILARKEAERQVLVSEFKSLVNYIPSTIRVGGGMYRSMSFSVANLEALRASVATAKAAYQATFEATASKFFQACVQAGVDVLAPDFVSSELSLRAQAIAFAEAQKALVFTLKTNEQARLEAAGYEVYFDASLEVVNGTIKSREASAQSAKAGKTAVRAEVARRNNTGRVVWSDSLNKVATQTKELVAVTEEVVIDLTPIQQEVEVAKASYEDAQAKLQSLVDEDFEGCEVDYEHQYELLSAEFDEAEKTYVAVHNKLTEAKERGTESITRYMLVVKDIVVPTAQSKADKQANREANLERAKNARPHRLANCGKSSIKEAIADRHATVLEYLSAIANGADKTEKACLLDELIDDNQRLSRLAAIELRRGNGGRKNSKKGQKQK